MAVEPRLMTAAELLEMPDDGRRHELVQGELRTMAPSGAIHGRLALRLAGSIDRVLQTSRSGAGYGAETGFKIRSNPDTVRAPDAAYVRQDRLDAEGSVSGFFPGAPDIAFEVLSPHDLYTEVEEKVVEWLGAGCEIVFVVDPRRRSVSEYRPGQALKVHTVGDELQSPDIFPGWSLSLEELFSSL